MRVHFAAVGESKPSYISMMKGLLYSFRKNAGIYRDCPFTIVTNGSSIPAAEILNMKAQFGPVDFRAMPRLGGPPHTNKYNAFYAIDESAYDVLVLIDCDTLVLEPLDEITEGIDIGKPVFKAVDVGREGPSVVLNYGNLIKYYAGLTDGELKSLYNENLTTGYPYFNSGVIVASKEAVLKIRNDTIQIGYSLFKHEYFDSFVDYLLRPYYLLLTRGKFKFLPEGFQRFAKSLMPRNSAFCRNTGQGEQVALAISLIKHKVECKILHRKYNSRDIAPDESMPAILHYCMDKFDVDWKNLLRGKWIEEFRNSNSPERRVLVENLTNANSQPVSA